MGLKINKKEFGKNLLRGLVIILVFVLPVATVIGGVWLFRSTISPKPIVEEDSSISDTYLEPSEILNNKSEYNEQVLVLRGRVVAESMVCEKKECPPDDPCCGCRRERDLHLVDAGTTILSSKTKSLLRLLGQEQQSFCQRKASSCDYDCGDWQEGAIYDVEGTFFAEPPLVGWQMSLDFYFKVKNKHLAAPSSVGRFTFERFNYFLNDIKVLIKRLGTSGSFILD